MRSILFLLTLFVFSSCSDLMEGTPKPDDLIPRDTMVMVLKDMTLIESHIQTKYMHVSHFQKTMKASGKQILDAYHLSHKRYEESMDYYGSRQDQMQSIYVEILDSLNHLASIKGKGKQFKDTSEQRVQPGILGVKPRI